MLTRAQVARRLGKSIATVRRLEGDALHPEIDERGVHWFAEAEVERFRMAARDESKSRLTCAAHAWLNDRNGADCEHNDAGRAEAPIAHAPEVELKLSTREAELQRREVELARVLDEQARRAREELERIERAELIAAAGELLQELEDCPGHIVASVLDREMLEELAVALDLEH